MVARVIYIFDNQCILLCDGKCDKAWGISNRPKIQLSEDEDDYEYLADSELGKSPVNPGTYEGGHGKPSSDCEKLNKWCCRECERASKVKGMEHFELKDFSTRYPNKDRRRK